MLASLISEQNDYRGREEGRAKGTGKEGVGRKGERRREEETVELIFCKDIEFD